VPWWLSCERDNVSVHLSLMSETRHAQLLAVQASTYSSRCDVATNSWRQWDSQSGLYATLCTMSAHTHILTPWLTSVTLMILSTTCDSSTDAVSHWKSIMCAGVLSRRLLPGRTWWIMWSAVLRFFVLLTVNIFSSVNEKTYFGEYFWATVLNGKVLHGSSLHSAKGSVRFLSTNSSQGSVATRLRRGGIFNYCFSRNLLLSLSVKELWKSISIWQS